MKPSGHSTLRTLNASCKGAPWHFTGVTRVGRPILSTADMDLSGMMFPAYLKVEGARAMILVLMFLKLVSVVIPVFIFSFKIG